MKILEVSVVVAFLSGRDVVVSLCSLQSIEKAFAWLSSI